MGSIDLAIVQFMPLVYLLSLSGFHAIQDKRKRPRTIFLQAERCLGGRSERLLLLQTFRLNKLLVSQVKALLSVWRLQLMNGRLPLYCCWSPSTSYPFS
jgi:hypothetical protein